MHKLEQTKYYCEHCNYRTNNRYDWDKHITTNKHKKKNIPTKPSSIERQYTCVFCNTTYKHLSGLSRHKKKCQMNNIKQNKRVVIVNKIGNTINNHMTINLFLNEECKNAMNLTEFIDSLSPSIEDLQYTKENGYIKGITNIFYKNLRDIDPVNRPIHCCDKKKLQFYIKDEDKWNKDNENKHIDKSIETITQKQIQKIIEWMINHPNWNNDEENTEIYMSMIKELMGGTTIAEKAKNKQDIIKYLGHTTDINKINK